MNIRKESGLTLIEIAITIVVIAALLVLGLPSFSELMTNLRIRTASESVMTGLKTARTEAVRRNTIVSFVINAADPAWQVRRTDTLEVLAQSDFGTTPVVTALSPADTFAVTFNTLGIATTNPDGSLPLAQIDLTVPESVLAAENARNLRILISGGMIKMCDPNVSGDARSC
ncbi:MAG: pilus assembly protein FimT [Betaproteobacteria bacterium HGW-Betaproteobacteria-14]|nr:MAG: pilus assembly protein FimT [Betaproteobacteria bacterium HGW-Betaproteobacteria-14]